MYHDKKFTDQNEVRGARGPHALQKIPAPRISAAEGGHRRRWDARSNDDFFPSSHRISACASTDRNRSPGRGVFPVCNSLFIQGKTQRERGKGVKKMCTGVTTEIRGKINES